MVGLLQIIIILGCIHLVMKVFDIYQTGLAVPSENRRLATVYGIVAMILGFGGAALCFWLMLQQSAAAEPPYWGG